jgi:formylglycine-generating enzyme required for sulfatase activity
VLDMAGNVFQWTSTELPAGQAMVKGSAWEDFAGMGRGASGHGRTKSVRHVIIGFRCAADPR